MELQSSKSEYLLALRSAQREVKECTAAGRPGHPAVLDDIVNLTAASIVDAGLVEIPAQKIIGTCNAGRVASFSPSFLPLLDADSEFAAKWAALCSAHLSDEGIRDPILCYEYLGSFYVQEGNKRVSVLRHFDAPRIPGHVKRILPPSSQEPRIRAYYEFLDFYKATRLYDIQFRRPGDYAKLLVFLGKGPEEIWDESQKRSFRAGYSYFLDAFHALKLPLQDTLAEEALLLWLQVHSFESLSTLSSAELRKSLAALWPDVITSTRQSEVTVSTEPVEEPKTSLLGRIISPAPESLGVAFVHQLDAAASLWVLGHEEGRKHIEAVFGSKITVHSYYGANSTQQAIALLEQAVADGAQLVFATAPTLIRAALTVAVRYPRVRFLNCSVDQPYSSVRTYYGRIYEAKFITGAIAGAMAQNGRIGYIGSNPIFGVPASINAFALGAQLTNPRAQIELRWSCCPGTPQADFFRDGIRVISNRDVPSAHKIYLEFCNYGTYLMNERDVLVPLASPVWMWGNFYEFAVNAVLSGTWKEEKSSPKAVNYWLGMDSGLIDIRLSSQLPEGIRSLAEYLRQSLRSRQLDPFFRRITAQDGTVKNDGSQHFSPEALLKMDWLCENVTGHIPSFQEIAPSSQAIVRNLGIYRDQIPADKESAL